MQPDLPYRNRSDAGRLLAEELAHYKSKADVVVLGLTRGGVPVAAEVASALHAPLDVVVVRKLGVPFQPELAMGAIAGDDIQVLDKQLVHALDLTNEDVEGVIIRERIELQRRERIYRGGRPALVLAFASQGNAHDSYFFRRAGQMIAGAVAPARMDLANRELVEAHLHSVWLAQSGIALHDSVTELLDLESPGYPLEADCAAQIQLSAARQREVVEALRAIGGGTEALQSAPWYSEQWLGDCVRDAPRAFDEGFVRWRELYRAARDQQGVRRRAELGPHHFLDARQGLQHLVLQFRRILAVVGVIIIADFGRNRETRGNRQGDVRHLGQIGPFASQKRPHLGLAVGLPLAEEIHVLTGHTMVPLRAAGYRGKF